MSSIKHTLQKNLYLCMKNNKSINIYMGIIGEAYVDKETAYAVLLAAKKNILDVQAIIEAANALNRPLTKAQIAAETAITRSVQVYNNLKNAISLFEESDPKFAKLYALLSDLNENDFDDNFSNGGNIFTARENLTFAQSLESEIHEILILARDLLDANKLNAVVRCKEYNIAKEIFEAMIPEKIVSPEDISDAMEAELLRRINEVRNNIDYVNLVSDEIIAISDEVDGKIDKIVSGADENVKPSNETLYWYAGNICPYNNEQFMEELGFTWSDEFGTYLYRKVTYEDDGVNIKSVEDLDFGIDGPLRANKWFHHPLHLIQDGQLIAGVDGGKAKYQYWYVVVPRYIPTAAGSTEYVQSGAKAAGKSISEWAAENGGNTEWVDSLYPCKPRDYEHIDDAHGHPIWNNEWMDRNENGLHDEDADDNNWGYEKITTPDSALSINGILYDAWRTPVTMYNKQRLNVYFNFGEPETKETARGLYWYIGKNKPTYNSDPLHEEGWHQLDAVPTAENPIPEEAITLDSKIFYIAIPKGFGIFNAEGVDLTNPELEAESPYTIVYTTLIGSNTYNVFITGNEASTFADKIYAQEGTDIDIDPTPDPTPDPEPEDGPQVPDTPQVDEGTYYWYSGLIKPNASNIRNLATGSSNSIEHWEGKEFNITNNTSSVYPAYVCTPVDFEVTWKDTNGFTMNLIEVDGARFTFNGVEYKVQKRGRDLAAGATLTVKGYNEVGGQGGGQEGGGQEGGGQGGDEHYIYWYLGNETPTAANIASIATGSATVNPSWSSERFDVTNNSENSSYLYICVPSSMNIDIKDTNGFSVNLPTADDLAFNFDNTDYTVKRTGRPVSAGTTVSYVISTL